MGFKLEIYSEIVESNSQPSTLTIGLSESNTHKIGFTDSTVTLVDLNFEKKMYQPGRIGARLQITKNIDSEYSQIDKSYYLHTKEYLTDFFLNAKVNLLDATEDSNNNNSLTTAAIAEDYIIYDVLPQYSSSSLYVDLVIYSPDYPLTQDIGCRTYVAKQLGEEILKPKFTNCEIKLRNQLIFTNETYNSNTKKKETTEDEYIHPYLVQYNESFWDFLTRTANRWGEFVYYENKHLILGRESNSKSVSTYTSLTYLDESTDPALLANSKKTVTTDDYLSVINKGTFIGHSGDMTAHDATWNHKIAQAVTAMKGTIWEHATSWAVDSAIEAAQNEKYLKIRQDRYNKIFFGDPLEPKAKGSKDNKNGELLTRVAKHYNSEKNKCRQFAYYDTTVNSSNQMDPGDGGLTVKNYEKVRDAELKVSETVLLIDLGENHQDLRLGDVFTFENSSSTSFLVIGVKGEADITTDKQIDTTQEKIVDVIVSAKSHYYVRAVPKVKPEGSTVSKFYPPMLPTGHIRFSGPQRGTVAVMYDWLEQTKMEDPQKNGRYRVRNSWQKVNDTPSPWLRVSRKMQSKNSGAVWQLEEGTEVLLDFEDGNVELPYIVGALQTIRSADKKKEYESQQRKQEKEEKEARSQEYKKSGEAADLYDNTPHRETLFNNMDLCTPAGHAIRLTDGYGGGSDNFAASFMPIAGWCKAFTPDTSALHGGTAQSTDRKDERGYDEKFSTYKCYEGGMEITDKYGIYSIKTSTDERNITIKSPYGDVQLNAFTGITIEAPNGDIKIEGKNVSIEAGNTITLESGKNIAKGIFGSTAFGKGHNYDGNNNKFNIDGNAVGASIGGAFADKVASFLDIPLIRHAVEILLRPVNGSLKLHSNKYMILHAGINVERANNSMVIANTGDWVIPMLKNNNIAQMIAGIYDNRYIDNTSEISSWGRCAFVNGDVVFERHSNDASHNLNTGAYDRNAGLRNRDMANQRAIQNNKTFTIKGKTFDINYNYPNTAFDPQEQGDVRDKLDATHEGFV